MSKYMHKETGAVDTREGWISSYGAEELEAKGLTAEEAFEEDEGVTLIAIVTINGDVVEANKVPQIIQDQPGYSGEGAYVVARATTGGYRLYKAVGMDWMDASLEDRPELVACLPSPDAARALRAIPSDKRKSASVENGKKPPRPGSNPRGRPRKAP